MKKREAKPGIRVVTNMGVHRTGLIVSPFYWKESNDGTYKAPGKDDVPVEWDDGKKGYHNVIYLTKENKQNFGQIVREMVVEILEEAKNPFKKGDKVKLRKDVLARHSRSVSAHAGYTSAQFDWRATLNKLAGQVGEIERTFSGKHVNVKFKSGIIGIDYTELEPVNESMNESKTFKGKTNTGEKLEIEQRPNGMFVAELKDKDGEISGTTAHTMAEVNEWLYDHGVKKIKWSDGKTTMVKEAKKRKPNKNVKNVKKGGRDYDEEGEVEKGMSAIERGIWMRENARHSITEMNLKQVVVKLPKSLAKRMGLRSNTVHKGLMRDVDFWKQVKKMENYIHSEPDVSRVKGDWVKGEIVVESKTINETTDHEEHQVASQVMKLNNRKIPLADAKKLVRKFESDAKLPVFRKFIKLVNNKDFEKAAKMIVDEEHYIREVKKTKSAQKVLQLMDKYEDGDGRYEEFVKKVAKEDNISVKQLEKELEPFI